MRDLNGKKIAILVNNSGVERVELTTPWSRFEDAGAQVTVVAPQAGTVQSFDHDVEKAETFQAGTALADAEAGAFDALIIPGGTTNADRLRLEADALSFVTAFAEAGKPIASICHGPWLLVETGLVRGKTLTSFPSLQTDVRNAGGTWVDQESFTCPEGGFTLVTSRKPDDLDAFVEAAAEAVA